MPSPTSVDFVIGGETITLGPLSLWSLARCWAAITAMGDPELDVPGRGFANCEVIAAALQNDPKSKVTAEDLMRRLSFSELLAFDAPMAQLLRLSGFTTQATSSAPAGGPPLAGAETGNTEPSTETSLPPSPS